jgi:WD40 repeat protein
LLVLPGNRAIVAGLKGGQILEYLLVQGRPTTATPRSVADLGSEIRRLVLADGGRQVLATVDGPVAQLWPVANGFLTGESTPAGSHEGKVRVAEVSQDGRWIVTGSSDWRARLIDARDHAGETETLSAHDAEVTALAVNRSGGLVASGDDTGVVWMMRLDDLGQVTDRWRFSGHQAGIVYLAFADDDRGLQSMSVDGTLRYWPLEAEDLVELACTAAGRELDTHEWSRYFGPEPQREICGSSSQSITTQP